MISILVALLFDMRSEMLVGPEIISMDVRSTAGVLVLDTNGPQQERLVEIAKRLLVAPVFQLSHLGEGTGYGLIGFVSQDTHRYAIQVVAFNLVVADAAVRVFSVTQEGDDIYNWALDLLSNHEVLPGLGPTIAWTAAWFDAEGVSPDQIMISDPLMTEVLRRAGKANTLGSMVERYVPVVSPTLVHGTPEKLAALLVDYTIKKVGRIGP